MEQDVKGESRVCRTPPGPLKIGLSTHTDRREAIVAASLITILSITVLSTYILWLPPPSAPPSSHGFIEIDGDANFAATALLEGWPGDGSPENPFIIDGLEIDREDAVHCIMISNTRVGFTIRNCNLTGHLWRQSAVSMYSGSGIYLENVSYGELVNNICRDNAEGIYLFNSTYNVVVNNTCIHNRLGIILIDSNANTISSNICKRNSWGIHLSGSNANTISSNICNANDLGIYVKFHDTPASNLVIDNTCNRNQHGILIHGYGCDVDLHTVMNNTCNGNSYNGFYFLRLCSSIVANNTCNSNRVGMFLLGSNSNTVANNSCNGNDLGISFARSNSTTVVNNTCVYNMIAIYQSDSQGSIISNNTLLNNFEYDIADGVEIEQFNPSDWYDNEEENPEELSLLGEEFDPVVLLFVGFPGIIMLCAAWRMLAGMRKFD
ncbi:MAG: nitrous oxide reductase family maturation protein NosD [Candidatus Thorarchaeota archaeon]